MPARRIRPWRRMIIVITAGLLAAAGTWPAVAADAQSEARQVLDRVGAKRGICVVLANEPDDLAAVIAMARQSELTVYLQHPSQQAVAWARRRLNAEGLLGTRIYVEQGSWSRIHLADNLADAVVVLPSAVETAGPHRRELLRVVRPLGKLLLGGDRTEKPMPAEVDQWSHAYKGPDNNPQSRDELARAPYLTQFLCEPWYVPFPEVTVTSGGRVFKAFGHVGYKRRDWPWVNKLVAINGFNGTMLWQRPLEEGFNIHRNTMVATKDVLYVADGQSCKLLDPATGEVKAEITAPEGSTGPAWKWMAIEDGVLYAMVGRQEPRDETIRGTRTDAGWPWSPMTKLYDQQEYVWGFGRTLFAMDLKAKKVLWMHKEEDPIDGRAMAMSAGRIFGYAEGKSLVCLDAQTGDPIWRNSEAKLLEAIGPTLHAQRPDLGFSTMSYMKCSDRAVYFAGPQREKLVAVSADEGKLLWTYPHGNFMLILREQGLYAMGRTGPSKLFEPLTGRVLADLAMQRGNCTRATGTVDSIFTRGYRHGGTTRVVVAENRPQRIALMRPDCNDGVIVANGLLYWGPWMCDCSLSLVGIVCLGPAGDFPFHARADQAERLESIAGPDDPVAPLAVAAGDWPTYRADNRRSAARAVDLPTQVARAWGHKPKAAMDPAAPVTAGGLVFTTGSDGVVRAWDAAEGKIRWQAFTGGPITYPPGIEDGRLFVGSGDGWVYAFEAATGRPLWRFRAAPAQRKINLYGKLTSTWPVASGALVQDGVVYAAAGIASYDGTHVYALDARTGHIRWQNNGSGRLGGEQSVTGVSVQGHLLLHRDRLYLAGGNVVSPAVYDPGTGRCLNTLEDVWAKAPRGRELFVIGGKVTAFERLLYAPKEYWPGRYFPGHLLQADSGDVLIRGGSGRVVRIDPATAGDKKTKTIWDVQCFRRGMAMALGNNAVVVAGELTDSDPADPQYGVTALDLKDGRSLWRRQLPAMPVSWGLATDAGGRIVIALQDGGLLCLAAKE